jgi:hypothetical protein
MPAKSGRTTHPPDRNGRADNRAIVEAHDLAGSVAAIRIWLSVLRDQIGDDARRAEALAALDALAAEIAAMANEPGRKIRRHGGSPNGRSTR